MVTTAVRISWASDTQRICPASSSFRLSPPCGSFASIRICAVEASTNRMPISASCTSGRLRSVQVSSSAPASAAAPAAACAPHPVIERSKRLAAITPSPATWAIARSMNTMPRASTCWPSGTCETATSRPAASAGHRIVRSVSRRLIASPPATGRSCRRRARRDPSRPACRRPRTAAARPARGCARQASRPLLDRCRRCAGSCAAARR